MIADMVMKAMIALVGPWLGRMILPVIERVFQDLAIRLLGALARRILAMVGDAEGAGKREYQSKARDAEARAAEAEAAADREGADYWRREAEKHRAVAEALARELGALKAKVADASSAAVQTAREELGAVTVTIKDGAVTIDAPALEKRDVIDMPRLP